MIWKRKLQELMILRRSSTGVLQPILTSRYDSTQISVLLSCFSVTEINPLHLAFGQLENYQVELEEMKKMSRQEFVAHLRR